MSEHRHTVRVSWIPGVVPREVELTHSHSVRPEEPHRHRWVVNLHAEEAFTIEEKSA